MTEIIYFNFFNNFYSMRGFIRHAYYSTLDIGVGKQRKLYLLDKAGNKISFWNDVPLKPESSSADIFNSVIEIPRYTLAKLELARDEKHHPLMHDLIKNRLNPTQLDLRHYAQFGFFNYGLFPQTWESILVPNHEIENIYGDNDPLDMLEITDSVYAPGSIIPVKVLGIFALIDEGELDWKVITVHQEEAKRRNIKNLEDVEREFPCRIKELIRWFRVIKTFDGKKMNRYAFDEKIFGAEKAIEIIHDTHKEWKALRTCLSQPETALKEHRDKLIKIATEFHMTAFL